MGNILEELLALFNLVDNLIKEILELLVLLGSHLIDALGLREQVVRRILPVLLLVMLHGILSNMRAILGSQPLLVVDLDIAMSQHMHLHFSLLLKSSFKMLLVTKTVDLLEVLNHLLAVLPPFSIGDEWLIFFFLDLTDNLLLVLLPWNKVDHVVLELFPWQVWVLYLSFLWAIPIDILGHLHLLRRRRLLLGLDSWVIDLGLLLLTIHPIEHIANFVASPKLFPEVLVHRLLLAQVVLVVDLILVHYLK